MQKEITDEHPAYHADRVLIMELIKGLADELQEFSSKEPCLLPNICGEIKELSDDMISILYDNAAWYGVSAKDLKVEVIVQYIEFLSIDGGDSAQEVDRALNCSPDDELNGIALSQTLTPQSA